MAATNERNVEKIRHVEFFQANKMIVLDVISYQFIYGHSLCSIRDTPMNAQQFSLPSTFKKRLRQSTIFSCENDLCKFKAAIVNATHAAD